MSETIEQLQDELAAAGRGADQVQRSGATRGEAEGTYVCGWDGDAFVVRQLGRGEHDDRREDFASEAAAVAALRSRLLSHPGRATTAEEQQQIRVRMQRRAQETLERLDADD